MGTYSKKKLKSSPQKVNICPYILYSMQLLFYELVIIICFDILKVGAMEKSGKKVTSQYLEKNYDFNGFALRSTARIRILVYNHRNNLFFYSKALNCHCH